MRLWSCGGCGTTPSTSRPRCPGPTGASLNGKTFPEQWSQPSAAEMQQFRQRCRVLSEEKNREIQGILCCCQQIVHLISPLADVNRLSVFSQALVQHRNDDFLLWGVKSHFWVGDSSMRFLCHTGSAEIGLIFVTSGPNHVGVGLEMQPRAGGNLHLRIKNWKL